MAEVRVRRPPGGLRDRWRSYSVLVDGRCSGRLRRGGTVTVPVAPGPHVVQVRIDWTGSEEVTVTVADGEVVSLTASPGTPIGTFAELPSRTRWVRLTVDGA